MADNPRYYGIRWSLAYNSVSQPKTIELPVASGQNFNVTGDATNLNLNVGDQVQIASTGTITLSPGNETTTGSVWGIVVGFGGQGYFNGTRMVRSPFLPSGVTYGTSIDRQSRVLVVPVSQGFWEADCDDNVSATTFQAYQAFVGENVDVKQTVQPTLLQANPMIDISTHAVTSTLQWRIAGISQNLSNQDFSGQYVKLVININKGAETFFTATGT